MTSPVWSPITLDDPPAFVASHTNWFRLVIYTVVFVLGFAAGCSVEKNRMRSAITAERIGR